MNKIELTKKHKEKFNGIRFLALAVAKDASRPALQLIKVKEDGTAIACDGFRIHTLKNCGLPGGFFYRVLKVTKAKVILERAEVESNFLYPDTNSIIPENTEKLCSFCTPVFLPLAVSQTISLYTLKNVTKTIQYNYILEAIGDLPKYTDITVSYEAGNPNQELLVIKVGLDKTAYISPMKVEV